MALGAEQWQVLRMVLREVAVLTGSGITVGLGVTLAATPLVASFLYGVRPNDPDSIFGGRGVLAATAAAAGYWPVRRASRLDPMASLREE
jgi:ABC-type antimicrobial peptide transport system permease subunit